tara:strand:+ start:12918 stop:14642 length:1725 start_codon:yes stop_codon:yes gene_type:complete
MFSVGCSIFLLLAASAQEVIFRQVADTKTDTHVEVTSLFSHPSLGGYLPVRIIVANNQKVPHKIFLRFKDATNYSDEISTSSSYSFVAPPGRTVSQDILVPLTAQNGTSSYQELSVNLNGSMGNISGNVSTVFSPDQPAVLLSESLYTPNGSALDTERNSRGSGSYGRSSSNSFSSKFDPKRLPDDWRAFSGFDSIMLTETDWAATPPGSRNAILSWMRLGGQLVVYSQSPSKPSAIGIPEDTSFGTVVMKRIAADLRLDAKETVSLSIPKSPTRTRLNSVTNDFNAKWPIQIEFGEKSFNYVVFIIILIAFGILVGPVNLFVFAKSGQRHRLFITTPLISLGTSLILIVLIILQDGFGGDGSRMVLMEVRPDENQNAAFIQQEQFSRTGVMTSPGFTVDASALIVPVPLSQSRWARFTDGYDSRGTYNIQPTDGKLYASGDWFQSRSEQGQLITAVVPTRGRIEAASEPGKLISTFDFPIETLVFRDPEGTWYRAENITKGRAITPTPVDPTMMLPFLNELANRFTQRNRLFLNKAKARDDHFIAITSQAPGIETHTGIDWKTTTVITGPIAR